MILAFPRRINGGEVPDSLKNDHYVIGYHFMMCLNLYLSEVEGKTDAEEQGFVLAGSLAIALEMDASQIKEILPPLMADPDDEFTKGTEDANAAFAKVTDGDMDAFFEFNNQIQEKY